MTRSRRIASVMQVKNGAVQRTCHCNGECAECRAESTRVSNGAGVGLPAYLESAPPGVFPSEERMPAPQHGTELPLFLQRRAPEQTDMHPGGQTQTDREGSALDTNVADRIEAARGSGAALDDRMQARMEAGFGTRFDDVRVHTDREADVLSQSLGASAFTTGGDIFFRQGMYRPNTATGQQLLAHELTHVLQQRSSPAGEARDITPRDDHSEQEADAVSTAVTAGVEQPHAANQPNVGGVSGRNMVQRATDQPELQQGIGWGLIMSDLLGNGTLGHIGGGITQWILTCYSRILLPWQAVMLAYRIVRILAASGKEQTRDLEEFITGEIPPLSTADTFCDCIPAPFIALMAKYGLRDYPDALDHLNHYLEAHGAPYVEDIERMLDEDAGVRKRIEEGIAVEKTPSGRLVDWVDQGNYSTKNWWYSLGGVDLFTYEILQDDVSKALNTAAGGNVARVSVSIRDPYEWHPDEFRQIPCLHTGMEAMKAAGARDFWSVGEGIVSLHVPPKLVPLL